MIIAIYIFSTLAFFLFSKGFQLPVSIYWKGMIPFYLIFILFVGVNIAVKEIIIDSITDVTPIAHGGVRPKGERKP